MAFFDHDSEQTRSIIHLLSPEGRYGWVTYAVIALGVFGFLYGLF